MINYKYKKYIVLLKLVEVIKKYNNVSVLLVILFIKNMLKDISFKVNKEKF
jgi:hypothetical protein